MSAASVARASAGVDGTTRGRASAASGKTTEITGDQYLACGSNVIATLKGRRHR